MYKKLITITFAIGISILGYYTFADDNSITQDIEIIQYSPNSVVSLIAAGDNLIHSSIYKAALVNGNYETYDFTQAYEHIATTIAGYDLAILNQETPLANQSPSDYPLFNSPPELGDKMLELGFNAFSHANNHILDKGEAGLIDTLDFWKSRNAFAYGAYYDEADLQTIKTMTINDIVFSFIGVTDHTNGLALPADHTAQLLYTHETDKINALIQAANDASDVVIVSAHWGNEGTHSPTKSQKDLASEWVEAGAEIILGTHPHVIQPMEFIEKPDGGNAFVVYSLGNFISAQNQVNTMLGQLVAMNIIKNGATGSIDLQEVTAIPIVTHYVPYYQNITVYPLSTYTDDLARNHNLKINGHYFSKEVLQNIVNNNISDKFLTTE